MLAVDVRTLRSIGPALLALSALWGCHAKEPAREAAPPARPVPESTGQEALEESPAASPEFDAHPVEGEAERWDRGAAPPPAAGAAPSAEPAPGRSRASTPRKSKAASGLRDQSQSGPTERSERLAQPELLLRRLDAAVELATPNCPAARSRKQAICDLAEQICQLVDRDPNVASVAAYCADARRRCSEAGQQVSERCP